MNLVNGWPNNGECGEFSEFCDAEVTGDATVTVCFDANFGCLRWKTVQES
jgi:hypothetical protein